MSREGVGARLANVSNTGETLALLTLASVEKH